MPYIPQLGQRLAMSTLAILCATTVGAASPLDADAPKPLPAPPALAHYTLESPLVLVLTIFAAAGVAYVVLNNAGKRRQALRASLALAVAAAALYATALAVHTPRERITELTKRLVRDTAEADISALDADLTDDVRLYTVSAVDGMSKDRILNLVRTNLGKDGAFAMENYAVLEAQVDIPEHGPAQVQVKVRVTGRAPIISWWRLDAVPAGPTWKFSGIKYLSSNWPIPSIS